MGSTIAGLEEADELTSDEGLPGEARRILSERAVRFRVVRHGVAVAGGYYES